MTKYVIRNRKTGEFYGGLGEWVASTSLATPVGSVEAAMELMTGGDFEDLELLRLSERGYPAGGFLLSTHRKSSAPKQASP